MKKFAPFSYLNHSFILSLNVKVCVRFIVFLQIWLCFFTCQELCWMRGLCISFTSTCFLFPIRGEVKSLRTRGGGCQKLSGLRGLPICVRGYFRGSVPHYMLWDPPTFHNISPRDYGMITKVNSWAKVISSCLEDRKTMLDGLFDKQHFY